jgi:hypothetical protein
MAAQLLLFLSLLTAVATGVGGQQASDIGEMAGTSAAAAPAAGCVRHRRRHNGQPWKQHFNVLVCFCASLQR